MLKTDLFQLVKEAEAQCLAIGGLAKNAGKTVVLNYLVQQAAQRKLKLGVTSIGYDGEKQDTLSGHAKPQVWLPAGTKVATAANLVRSCPLDLIIECATGEFTSLGEVYIVELQQSGCLELAGPSSIKGLQQIKNYLQVDCEQILIDGALNRLSVLTSRLSEASILAIRPQRGCSFAEWGQKVASQLALLRLPAPPVQLAQTARQCFERQLHALLEPDGTILKQQHSYSALLTAAREELKGRVLVLNGSVTERMKNYLESLAAIIVPDASHIFLSQRTLTWLAVAGVRLYTLWPMNILALTMNPAPPSYVVDIVEFGEAISFYVPDLWIFDVQSGLSFRGGKVSNEDAN